MAPSNKQPWAWNFRYINVIYPFKSFLLHIDIQQNKNKFPYQLSILTNPISTSNIFFYIIISFLRNFRMFCLPYFWYVRVSLSAFRYVLSGSVYSVYCRGSPLQVLWIWRGWNFGARRCFVRRFDEFFRAYSNVEVARQTLEKKKSGAKLSWAELHRVESARWSKTRKLVE